jgi:hypothetical protein
MQFYILPFSVADPDPGSGAFLTPGCGMGKKSRSGIRDENPGSYFLELRNTFWVKILKFLDVDADPGIFLTLVPGRKKIECGCESAPLIPLYNVQHGTWHLPRQGVKL